MKKLKKRNLIVAAVIACVLLAGCAVADTVEVSDVAGTVEVSDIEPIESIEDIVHPTNPGGFAEDVDSSPSTVSGPVGSWIEFRIEDLMEKSSIIVYGRVSRISGPFLIESVLGHRAEAVDFYIEPYKILRGDASLDEVVVREIVSGWDNPQDEVLEIGDAYLLFLTVPAGDVLDTPGEYFYALPFSTLRPREMQDDGDIVFAHSAFRLLSELREMLVEVNETVPPPDEASIRQRGIDNLIGNMERGVLEWDQEFLDEVKNMPLRPARIVEID